VVAHIQRDETSLYYSWNCRQNATYGWNIIVL